MESLLRNGTATGDVNGFVYGAVGWKGVTGDWTGQGLDTIGVVDTTGNASGDLWYLRNQSFCTDLKLLLRTPASVLSCRGAY